MKKLMLLSVFLLTASTSFSQEKTESKETELQEHIQMHEKMMKAHQEAADCLKSGKSEEDCKKAFHEMCKEAGEHGMCGSGMMDHKMGKKHKK